MFVAPTSIWYGIIETPLINLYKIKLNKYKAVSGTILLNTYLYYVKCRTSVVPDVLVKTTFIYQVSYHSTPIFIGYHVIGHLPVSWTVSSTTYLCQVPDYRVQTFISYPIASTILNKVSLMLFRFASFWIHTLNQ